MGTMFEPNPSEWNLRTVMPGATCAVEPGMVFHMP
jgi:hypothetical protein